MSPGSAVTGWGVGGAGALRPKAVDFDSNGATDSTYLTDVSLLVPVDEDSSPRETNVGGTQADTQNTALSVGSRDGSPTAVFYAGEDHSRIYRVVPGGDPTAVTSPGDGVNVVLGSGNIDGDGRAGLVFAGGSQTIRYLGSGSSIELTGQTAGSGSNVGAGRPDSRREETRRDRLTRRWQATTPAQLSRGSSG